MNKNISLKKIIIANISLFIISFLLMKFSDFYRLNKESNWIYQYAHILWMFFALPISMISSLILPFIYFKKFGLNILWILLGTTPIILFITIPYQIERIHSILKNIWIVIK